MLEIRPCCEHCGKDLPNESTDAMICSFECTYCKDCALDVFKDVCPSCGGNFVSRPIRPKIELEKKPGSMNRKHIPKNIEKHQEMLERYHNVPPEKR